MLKQIYKKDLKSLYHKYGIFLFVKCLTLYNYNKTDWNLFLLGKCMEKLMIT